MLFILIKEYFANKKGNRIDPLHTAGSMHAFHEPVLRLIKLIFSKNPFNRNSTIKHQTFKNFTILIYPHKVPYIMLFTRHVLSANCSLISYSEWIFH